MCCGSAARPLCRHRFQVSDDVVSSRLFVATRNPGGISIRAMSPEESSKQDPVYKRRSSRIVRRIPLLINTADNSVEKEWESVKTVVVSQHGGMIRTHQEFGVGAVLDIRLHDRERSARARVVWTSSKSTPQGLELGFEILDQNGFWDMTFPPDHVAQSAPQEDSDR